MGRITEIPPGTQAPSVWQSIVAPLPCPGAWLELHGEDGEDGAGSRDAAHPAGVCLLLWLLQEAMQPFLQERGFCLKHIASDLFFYSKYDILANVTSL